MTRSNRALGCLFLFALPFAAAGLTVAVLAARMLWLWAEVQDWRERPARILHAEIVLHPGEDSTTYELVARYRYELGGVSYEGDRIAVSGGADNIGSFHHDKYRELAAYESSDRLFRCFVDPDNPGRAILYREMRWGLFAIMSTFALVFTGAGLGLMGLGVWGKRKLDADERLAARFPAQPWRWRSEWSEGRIRASGKAQFLMPCIMATFWNLVSWPVLFALHEEVLENENPLALVALVFPLVGVGLVVWAARALIRWRRFGDSVFEMSTFPGVIGGRLAGRVLASVDLEPIDGFRLTLSCVRRVTSGSGDGRSTSERILWQDTHRLPHHTFDLDPSRSEIPVLFAIPFDCRPTDKRSDDDETVWRLDVEAEVPGVDYTARFDIPVFRTADSRADFRLEQQPVSEAPTVAEAPGELASVGIHTQLLPSGARRITFAAARHKGAAAMLTGFLTVWLGLIVLMVRLSAPPLFPILWGLFSLLLLYGTFDLWFERRSIEVHPDRLVLRGGIFGLGRTRTIPRQTIAQVRPVRGMQSGDKLFYRLSVRTRDGKEHIAATKLDSLSLARRVIDQL